MECGMQAGKAVQAGEGGQQTNESRTVLMTQTTSLM